MQTKRTLIRGVMVLAAMATTATTTLAQIDFDAGSNGSFGAINLLPGEEVTLDMPPDGIFNATTINIAVDAKLMFNKNLLNTPVFLLATGDITIDGEIRVDGHGPTTTAPDAFGIGGPGGFDGGTPGFGSLIPPGAGLGPGGGGGGTTGFDGCGNPPVHGVRGAGRGAFRARGTIGGSNSFCSWIRPQRDADGFTYGSDLLIPLVGGSGGGGTTGSPGFGGAGGGGAVLLASSTRISFSGLIISRGGDAWAAGSGGAIRLVAPIVEGSGNLDVHGGLDTGPVKFGKFLTRGGNGRVRVDTIDRGSLHLTTGPTGIMSVGSVLLVFPVERLDIIEAAGELIPEGQPTPVMISLPFGSPKSQTVTVQARGFTGIVPIKVVLTPDTGDPIAVESEIDMSLGDPAIVVVPVELPVNTRTRIMAWTR